MKRIYTIYFNEQLNHREVVMSIYINIHGFKNLHTGDPDIES